MLHIDTLRKGWCMLAGARGTWAGQAAGVLHPCKLVCSCEGASQRDASRTLGHADLQVTMGDSSGDVPCVFLPRLGACDSCTRHSRHGASRPDNAGVQSILPCAFGWGDQFVWASSLPGSSLHRSTRAGCFGPVSHPWQTQVRFSQSQSLTHAASEVQTLQSLAAAVSCCWHVTSETQVCL